MLTAAKLSNWIYNDNATRDKTIELPFSNSGKETIQLARFNLADEFSGKLATWAVTYRATQEGVIVFVVFRGTVSVQDMVIDLSLVPTAVPNPENVNQPLMLHSGIYLTATIDFDVIVESINEIVRPVCLRNMRCEVIITGHSLGGGQAQAFGVAYKSWLMKYKRLHIELKVFSFASPLMAWSSITSKELIEFLQEKKYKRYRVHDDMIHEYPPNENQRDEPKSSIQSYIFNIVNLKDIVPRLPFVIKFRYSVLNAIPNTLFAKFISGNNTNVVVGCKPLGHTYVIQVLTEERVQYTMIDVWNYFYSMLTNKDKTMKDNIYAIIMTISLAVYEWLFFGAFLFKQSFNNRLILNDYSKDHSWYMKEYNKTPKVNYPVTVGYNNTDDKNGWNVENHTAKYYYYNLKSCWDSNLVTISDSSNLDCNDGFFRRGI
jgi:Lipase (class 3)